MAKIKKQSVVIYEDWITVMKFLSKEEIIEFLNTSILVMKGEEGAITSSDGVRSLLDIALPDLLDNKNKRQKRSDIGKNNFKNNPRLNPMLTDIGSDISTDVGTDTSTDIEPILISIPARGNGNGNGNGNVDGNGSGKDVTRVFDEIFSDL
jgi:hypothetical protein